MSITQRGVCIAFDDATLEPDPTWTSLYDYHSDGLRVKRVTVDRGRAFELDKTQPGTMTIEIQDANGLLDVTNPSSPFYGSGVTKIDPLKQIAFFLTDPVADVEASLFRGFIESIQTVMDVSMKYMTHTITCVDALDTLGNAEVVPDPTTGNATYLAADVNGAQTRILAALADAGWPSGLATIFTGNVKVQETVYAPRDQILQVLMDAADGEFPGVANVFVSKDGIVTFHGRLARFNPTDTHYGINTWQVGDGAAVDADPTTVVQIATLEFDRDKANIFNAVLATPQNIEDADIAGQLVTDTGSIGQYGVRSKSFENLITEGGEVDGNDANAETKLFATYYKDNYAVPRNRVSRLSFTVPRKASPNRPAWWNFVCNVEISDRAHLKTTHRGGGGFDEYFFVEGVHVEATPLKNDYPQLNVDLDVSPAAYYDVNPF